MEQAFSEAISPLTALESTSNRFYAMLLRRVTGKVRTQYSTTHERRDEKYIFKRTTQ